MRILVNGYFYGGNCPVFVQELKKIQPQTKLINALGPLDEHGINYNYLTDADLIKIKLTLFEKYLLKILKLFRISIWKKILTIKNRNIIRDFNPDLIINHKLCDKAEIMLMTGFKPQISMVYGGEVHQSRVFRKELDLIFEKSDCIFTSTNEMYDHIITNRKDYKSKILNIPWGNYDIENIKAFKNSHSTSIIRAKYGLSENDIIILDTRSLRSEDAGLLPILESLSNLAINNIKVKTIFLRGFLGTDKMVDVYNEYLTSHPNLKDSTLLINEILSNDEIFELYFVSDIFISILKNDQLGLSILDAAFFDCQLILSDLPVYHSELYDFPFYLKNQDSNDLTEILLKIVREGQKSTPSSLLEELMVRYDSKTSFSRLNLVLESITNNNKN